MNRWNIRNINGFLIQVKNKFKYFQVAADAEQEKFRRLWNVKTIEHGMIRIPPHLLQDLIHKENIDKFFKVEDKPVAR